MSQDSQQPDPNHNIKLVIWIGFWALVLLVGTMLFQRFLDNERNPNTKPVSSYKEGVREVVLQRNRYGHYNLTGFINDTQVEFLVDTGATDISVPLHLANRIGLQHLYELQFDTANGPARGYGTRIDRVKIGQIELHDLDASINPNVDDDTVLLGMSFLKKIEFTQKGNTLILRQYDY